MSGALGEALSSFSLPFMQFALLGGLLVACTCAYLGVYLVLKRIVFLGAALAELAAAGLALGLLLGSRFDGFGLRESLSEHLPQASSLVLTLLGIILFWHADSMKRVSKESLIGVTWAGASALAILVVSKNPGGDLADLDLVSGNLLFINVHDLEAIALVAVLVGLLHLLLRKEFVFVSFDAPTARTLEMPAGLYDFLIYLSLGLTIAVSMRAVGVLFVISSLILPAVTGLLIGKRLKIVAPVAIAAAALSVVAGLVASFAWDFPTGPTVVSAQAALLLAAALGGRLLR